MGTMQPPAKIVMMLNLMAHITARENVNGIINQMSAKIGWRSIDTLQ